MFRSDKISEEDYKADLADIEQRYKHVSKKKNVDEVDWMSRLNEIVSFSESIEEVLKNGSLDQKRKVLFALGSNLVWNEENLCITWSKATQALIDGVKGMKVNLPEFEPKLNFDIQGLNEKTSLKRDVFSFMLPRQGSNLRPIDYTCPKITYRGGLYHIHEINLFRMDRGASADRMSEYSRKGDSLYTFSEYFGAWLGITHVGLHRVHLVFDLDFSRKLRYAFVYFHVTICAKKDTFIDFFASFFPRTCHSICRNSKIFFLGITMMKTKRSRAFFIATYFTLTATIFVSHFTNFLSSLFNSFTHIYCTVGIGSSFLLFIGRHNYSIPEG